MAQQPAEPTTPKAKPSDVGSIDSILNALYGVISGPAGEKRDWDRFRSLFIPEARLIPTAPGKDGGAAAHVHDVEGYVTRASAFFEKEGFYEQEIARRTEKFGNIVHVFSTYESRHAKGDPKPFARGINSIQLLKDGDRWWVVTIFWDNERPENPLPEEYLPKAAPPKKQPHTI